MDQYTLVYLTGRSDFSITKRYVHPQADKVRSVESERTKRGVSILSGCSSLLGADLR